MLSMVEIMFQIVGYMVKKCTARAEALQIINKKKFMVQID